MWLSAHDTPAPHQRRLLRAFRRQDQRRTRRGSIDRRILVRKHVERTRRQLRTTTATTTTTVVATWIGAVAVWRGRVRWWDADLPFRRRKDRADAGPDAYAARRRGRRVEWRDVVLEYAFVRPRCRVYAYAPGRCAAVARRLWPVPRPHGRARINVDGHRAGRVRFWRRWTRSVRMGESPVRNRWRFLQRFVEEWVAPAAEWTLLLFDQRERRLRVGQPVHQSDTIVTEPGVFFAS